VAAGAVPFSVQGTVTRTALDGGRTIGWELAEQLALARVAGTVRLFVQVGGGALAASLWQGFNDGIREQWLAAEPVLSTVQTEAAAPLNRAWRRLRDSVAASQNVSLDIAEEIDGLMQLASRHPDRYMWPWEPIGMSAATGILDDVTYDWLPVTRAMLSSHGMAYVVTEQQILEINQIARKVTGVAVDATGTAGLAPLLDSSVTASIQPEDHVVGLFTGVIRSGR
jgi:threonine synthase